MPPKFSNKLNFQSVLVEKERAINIFALFQMYFFVGSGCSFDELMDVLKPSSIYIDVQFIVAIALIFSVNITLTGIG